MIFSLPRARPGQDKRGEWLFLIVERDGLAGNPLKLIVGLGNPGPQYERTRHNVGFWFVEELARRHGGTFRFEARHQGETARVSVSGTEIWLLKPMTFMNRSGGPAQSVAAFYKVPVRGDPGRLRRAGFPAGHGAPEAGWRRRRTQRHQGSDRAARAGFLAFSASVSASLRARASSTCCTGPPRAMRS